jgi:hypothetical protein
MQEAAARDTHHAAARYLVQLPLLERHLYLSPALLLLLLLLLQARQVPAALLPAA